MKWSIVISLCFSLFGWLTIAAQTVGLMHQSPTSFNGYTLFSPLSSEDVYLIDNCGEKVHEWSTDRQPGLSAYLLDNGDLLRTGRLPGNIDGGGSGGRIERFDWEGNLIWYTDLSSDSIRQHHDIEPMPNGNMLVILWESIGAARAVSLGRQQVGPDFYNCMIWEIRPVHPKGHEVVWSWSAIDHLVQDANPTLPNYGAISSHPERIDINADPSASRDWIHANSIDYNDSLDQILISAHDVNEIWIIDHSTTIEEAASSSGGQSGKGGDLLYRWGNPSQYGRGGENNQRLFGQHDARWIPYGYEDGGSIMIYNNGYARPEGDFSTVDIIAPERDSLNNYVLAAGEAYGPVEPMWQLGPAQYSFYSSRISGASRLENGNTLVCVGRSGHFYEFDQDGQVVWEYVSPVSGAGIIMQGQNPFANQVFRITRYPVDHPAFDGRDMTPQGPIELDPIDYTCMIYSTSVDQEQASTVGLYPNPVKDKLSFTNAVSGKLIVTDAIGRNWLELEVAQLTSMDLSRLNPGMYVLTIVNGDKVIVQKMLNKI